MRIREIDAKEKIWIPGKVNEGFVPKPLLENSDVIFGKFEDQGIPCNDFIDRPFYYQAVERTGEYILGFQTEEIPFVGKGKLLVAGIYQASLCIAAFLFYHLNYLDYFSMMDYLVNLADGERSNEYEKIIQKCFGEDALQVSFW